MVDEEAVRKMTKRELVELAKRANIGISEDGEREDIIEELLTSIAEE